MDSRFASAENSSGGVSRMIQLKTLRNPSSVLLHLTHVQQFERILDLRAGGHEVEIRAFDLANALFERLFGQQEIRKSGRPLALEQVVNHGTAQIEIGQQNRAFPVAPAPAPDSRR